jgi:hypothetical protein
MKDVGCHQVASMTVLHRGKMYTSWPIRLPAFVPKTPYWHSAFIVSKVISSDFDGQSAIFILNFMRKFATFSTLGYKQLEGC